MTERSDMPSSSEMSSINRALGQVEASIETLTRIVEANQKQADESRRRLYEKVEQAHRTSNQELRVMAGTVSGLATRMDGLAARLDIVDPVIERIEQERLRREGATAQSAKQWAWMMSAAAFMGWVAHTVAPYLNSLFGRGTPPHGP